MFEKVNPSHPDKVADRIAGALVDYAYRCTENPRIAVEVLIGHGECTVIAETSVGFSHFEVTRIVARIASPAVRVNYIEAPQDKHLAGNQSGAIRCGDNGIFKGVPVTKEQQALSAFARQLYGRFPTDGKFILADGKLVICQSCVDADVS